MKGKVQILLLVVFAGSLFATEEETMEERKLRIKRKYLRQRADITYSTEVVPGDPSSDDDVVASEKFMEPQTGLEPEEPGAMAPPPVRRPPPQTVNRNWLLDAGDTEDPYAGQLGPQDEKEAAQQKDWTMQGIELEPSPYSGTLPERRFERDSYNPYSRQTLDQNSSLRGGGIFNPRSSYGEETQSTYQQQGSSSTGIFGSQDPAGETSYNPLYTPNQNPYGQETQTQPNAFSGSNPQTSGSSYTPYRSPFQTRQEQQQQSGSSGYTPYKSPFQTQQEQRQQWGGNTYNPPQQEFQRQNSYEQWKQRNPAPVNPLSDDAYIQGVTPGSRR